jgi:predicted RecB family nuclease
MAYKLRPPEPPPKDPMQPVEPRGLSRLPEPSPGDVFLDLEGDNYADEGGREYLFGITTLEADGSEHYHKWWAFSAAEERVAFEEVMDFIMRQLERDPNMHVYHFAPYEPTAFKRLMGRHCCAAAGSSTWWLSSGSRCGPGWRVTRSSDSNRCTGSRAT